VRGVFIEDDESLQVQLLRRCVKQNRLNALIPCMVDPEVRIMLLVIIVLLLLFGVGGGYYGHSRWGMGGGLGIFGTVVIIALVLYFLGVIH
jgi:hypothetical protein